MAKMFDKVSESFLDAIKSVTEKKLTPAEMKKREEVAKAIERDNPDMPMDKKMAIATATAKKVAEAKLDPVDHKALKGSHADRKDKDIDNDGKVDKTDEYLHNRRKAVKHAMAKKMKEEADIDEEAPKGYGGRAVTGSRAGYWKDMRDIERRYGNKKPIAKKKMKEEAELEESAEDKHFAKQSQKMQDAINSHLRRGKDYKTAVKHAQQHVNEDAEQIDEISAGMKARYKTKARGDLEAAQSFKSDLEHEGEPKTSRVSKDVNRIIKNRKMGMKRANEEAEQIDELSKETKASYMKKAGAEIDKHWDKSKTDARSAYKYYGRKNTMKKIANEEADLTPEEIAMIEAKMAGVADDALPGNEHMCATKVFHKEWKEGTPVPTMHADPDDEGLIEWYDVMFDHGIERVMTEDMEIVSEMSHGHKKRGMKKEDIEQIDELSLNTLGNYMDKASDARGHRGLSTKKIDNRYKGVALAQKKGDKQAAKMQGKLKPVKTDYERQMDDSHRHIYGEEADVPFEGPYKKTGDRKDEYGNTVKNVAKHLAKKAMNKQMGEEAEQIDEISAKTIDRYREQSHRKEYPGPKGSKKYEKRARGSIMAFNKLTGRAKVPARMEDVMTEARGRPKKAGQMDYTVHPKTKEKLMHNNPTHMKRIENLYRTGALKRPKTEAGQNIVTQLRKASTSMRGGETVNFTHGTAKHVSAAHAQKLLDKHAGMKPAEKEAFQKKIGHSHEEMKKHV